MSGIRVSDTGIGISKEFLPKVFNPFEQESMGHDRGYEGSGLGLSISKKYIELLGGEISVESEKNRGSSFEILLPRYQKV
ncbi:MAG: ATP-binding protein [Bacteroidota bacterium]